MEHPDAYKALSKDSYADNTFVIGYTLEEIKRKVEEWLEYFMDLKKLEKVRFPRSVVPKDADPDILTFGATLEDGNPYSTGAIIYGVWTKLNGSCVTSLLIAKAKLTPLQYKGETSRQ